MTVQLGLVVVYPFFFSPFIVYNIEIVRDCEDNMN